METTELLDPIVFTNNTKSYVYDKTLLTIEQVELVRELANFKTNQLIATPNTFKEVVKSGGADFLMSALSYLLIEKNSKNETLEFNRDKAENEVFSFVKKLSAFEDEKILNCVSDFFCSIKKESQLLQILHNPKKDNGIKDLIMSKMLEMMMMNQPTLTN